MIFLEMNSMQKLAFSPTPGWECRWVALASGIIESTFLPK